MPSFEEILSQDRFATYKGWAGGDDTLAVQLYSYNVQLSSALYSPLHMLEITLRNITDKRMISAYGVDWLDNTRILTQFQLSDVANARGKLTRKRKTVSHGQLVAELSFGFWCSLFGKGSHHLWGTLRPMFQAKGLHRSHIAQQLNDVRDLRNRVAHYEPILSLPLAQRYAEITTLTGWLSPTAAAWVSQFSTWPAVYPSVPILAPDPATGELRFTLAVTPYLPPSI